MIKLYKKKTNNHAWSRVYIGAGRMSNYKAESRITEA